IFGVLDPIGPQSGNLARTAWLSAGLPERVPATTVDRQCGSSQQALHFASQAVMSGTADLVVAGGVQNMSAIPISASLRAGREFGFAGPYDKAVGWHERYGDEEISQYRAADLIAEKWAISREEMEEFAVRSHERALQARAEGRFDREIVPLAGLDHDEGPRVPDWPKIRSLPTLRPDGRTTAALASQVSDGGAALLVASERAVREHGL